MTDKALSPCSSFAAMSGGKAKPSLCSYCNRDVSLQLRVLCAAPECNHEDKNVSLCGDCFSSGVQFDNHINSHPYRVIDCIEFHLFSRDWTTSEEILLLEGIDKCGVGNWKNISDYIGGNKGTKQCEEHYWELYMGIHGYCLPTKTIIDDKFTMVSTDTLLQSTIDNNILSNKIPVNENYNDGDIVIRDKGKEIGKGKDKQEIREKINLLPGSDLNGFLPLREDFDIEHENDAEIILADMEFNLDDHPSEKELKLQVIRIYNNKLSERDRRKRFVIDRGLVDFKKQQQLDRKRTKEERELVARMRMFARFHSAEEHDALVEGLLKARRLKQQIACYQHYRKMGIRNLEQATQYEIDRKKRDIEQKSKKQRQSASYLFETGRVSTGGASDSTTSSPRVSARGGSGNDSANSSPRGTDKNNDKKLLSRSGRRNSSDTLDNDDKLSNGLSSLKDKKSSSSTSQIELADMTKAPQAELLTDKELLLCQKVPMLPSHYLAAKECIVREAFRNGTLTNEGIKRIIKLDIPKTEKIYDFFVKEMPYITTKAHGNVGRKRKQNTDSDNNQSQSQDE